MSTESKNETPRSKCCGASLIFRKGLYHCFVCDKANEIQPPIINSKNETPRTEAVVAKSLAVNEDSLTEDLLFHARQLEEELNEAKRDTDNCRQIIETYSKQEGDLVQLAKENKVMREALEETSTHLDSLLKALSAAKREAQNNATDENELLANTSYWQHEKDAHITNSKLIHDALSQSAPSNLIVLTREELIAEIEKCPCRCTPKIKPFKSFGGMKSVKCHRCQWLARVKGQA